MIVAPVHTEIIPGLLSARIFCHQVDVGESSRRCWTYVTDGLWSSCRQQEIIFTLLLEEGEEPADHYTEPLELFKNIFRFGKNGRRVDCWGFTEFSNKEFLGSKALAYIPPDRFPGLELPEHLLAAILLRGDELEVAKSAGLSRVLINIGKMFGIYPCPTWSSRLRPPASSRQLIESSLLHNLPRVKLPGVHAIIHENQVSLRLLSSSAENLNERLGNLAADEPFALLTELDLTIAGCLVWEVEQRAPAAITAPGADGASLNGCFIILTQGEEDGGQLFEDGMVMSFSAETWNSLKNALATQESMTVQAAEGRCSFKLDWIVPAQENQVDEPMDMATEDPGPKRSASVNRSTRMPQLGRVKMTQVVLLSDEEDFSRNFSVTSLKNLSEQILISTNHVLSDVSEPLEIIVGVVLFPKTSSQFYVSTSIEVDREITERLLNMLQQLPPLFTREEEVRYQVHFSLLPQGNF